MRVFFSVLALAFSLLRCGEVVERTGEVVDVFTNVEGGDTSAAKTTRLAFERSYLPQQHYLVFRQRLPLEEMSGFLAQESEALLAAATRAGIEPTGSVSALFYEWNTSTNTGEAAVALPVAPGTQLSPYVTIKLPSAPVIQTELTGDYAGLSAAHFGLDSEIKRLGLVADVPTIEEYLIGPLDSVDPAGFRTKITYRLQSAPLIQ